MTTLQKTLLTVAFVAVAITGIYEARDAAESRAELQALRRQEARLAAQVQQLQRELDEATNRMAWLAQQSANGTSAETLKLRDEVTQLRAANEGNGNAPLASEANAWMANVSQIKTFLEQHPELGIPELQFLTAGDWLNAGREPIEDGEIGLRKTLGRLRSTAKSRAAQSIGGALTRFSDANEGRFPTDVMQLAPYAEPPLDSSILSRYLVVSASEVRNGDRYALNTEKLIAEKSAVDAEFDQRSVMGPHGRGISDFDGDILMPVFRAWAAANKGVEPGDPSQLLAYAQTPEQQQALQRCIQRLRNRR